MTAKELAKQLNLSEAAVSLALNHRPGVSTQTRNRVKEAALAAGMDIRSPKPSKLQGSVYLICYRKHGAVLSDTEFFSKLTEGIEQKCTEAGFKITILNILNSEELSRRLEEISNLKAAGIILLGTEMREEDFMSLAFVKIPIVLLDNHFLSSKIDSVQINNIDGAYLATNYLINKCHAKPGYLSSSYPLMNFTQRSQGFKRALTYNGLSSSDIILHSLTPSIEGAYHDMLEILHKKDSLASCYFADNDLIAIGAMRALKEAGYRIPQDISIIGFDDIPLCSYIEPALTTIHVPITYMGMLAADRLFEIMGSKTHYPVNVAVSTHLVIRDTIR